MCLCENEREERWVKRLLGVLIQMGMHFKERYVEKADSDMWQDGRSTALTNLCDTMKALCDCGVSEREDS